MKNQSFGSTLKRNIFRAIVANAALKILMIANKDIPKF